MKPGSKLARTGAGPVHVVPPTLTADEPVPLRRQPTWRRWLAGPPQGWTSVVLVVAMLWVMGLAVDEAPWGGVAATISVRIPLVPLLAVLSGLLGVVIGRSRFGPGRIRPDGRKLHDVHLFEVKSPAESRHPWDFYKLVKTSPAEEGFRPLAEGGCPLVT